MSDGYTDRWAGPLRHDRQHDATCDPVADGRLPGPFKGQSRVHTESDLRGYLDWCRQHDLDPLLAARPHLELYLRWLQEVRRFKP